MPELPIIVDNYNGTALEPVWNATGYYKRPIDKYPSAVHATFNPRAAIKDLDFTHWNAE
jgi:hypothetical protein